MEAVEKEPKGENITRHHPADSSQVDRRFMSGLRQDRPGSAFHIPDQPPAGAFRPTIGEVIPRRAYVLLLLARVSAIYLELINC